MALFDDVESDDVEPTVLLVFPDDVPSRIRLVLITNHIATHVPALVGSRATRSRACSGSLCICYPGDCHERRASNRSKIDFVHGVSSVVDR